jgi:hypothetical protein
MSPVNNQIFQTLVNAARCGGSVALGIIIRP